MNLRENEFDHVIERFYEAAVLPGLWPKALEVLANAMGATGANLMPLRPGIDTVITIPGIRGFIDQFLADGCLRINPHIRHGLELTESDRQRLFTSEDRLLLDQMATDPHVDEVQAARGFGPRAGMGFVDEGPELVLPIRIERGLRAEPFSCEEIPVLNRLMAKLEPAAKLAVAVRLSRAHEIAELLSDLGKDVILLGNSGRVLHLTPGAERLLGDVLSIEDGYLASWKPNVTAALEAAIKKAVGVVGTGPDRIAQKVVLPRRSSRRSPVLAQTVPIVRGAQDVFSIAPAILVVSDAELSASERIHLIETAFGLTRSEARLAHRIAQGDTLAQIAETERISLETARTRLKAVFAKTATHRQAELASVVTRFIP